MGLLCTEEPPDGIVGEGFGDAIEVHYFGHHEQHDKAAIGIDRSEALQDGGGWNLGVGGRRIDRRLCVGGFNGHVGSCVG